MDKRPQIKNAGAQVVKATNQTKQSGGKQTVKKGKDLRSGK